MTFQVRKRAHGDRVVQREQRLGDDDGPTPGPLLAGSGLPRRPEDQHPGVGGRHARLPVRR